MQRYVRSLMNLPPYRRALSLCDRTKHGRRCLNAISGASSVFSTMEEAWTVARRIKHAGHDHPEAVKIHMRFSEQPRPSDYPVLFWLATLHEQPLRLFDFGGNVGNLYYCYKRNLPAASRIEWTVFDIPAVVKQGEAIARDRNDTSIRFTDQLSDAAGCNVFLASGSLHYWESSVSDLLQRLDCCPEHIFINRSPLRQSGPSFATIQETNEYCVPCIVRNIDDVVTEFADHGYDLADQWTASELFIDLPLHPDYSVSSYSGLYFINRSRSRKIERAAL